MIDEVVVVASGTTQRSEDHLFWNINSLHAYSKSRQHSLCVRTAGVRSHSVNCLHTHINSRKLNVYSTPPLSSIDTGQGHLVHRQKQTRLCHVIQQHVRDLPEAAPTRSLCSATPCGPTASDLHGPTRSSLLPAPARILPSGDISQMVFINCGRVDMQTVNTVS